MEHGMEGIQEGKENEDRPVPPITLSLKVALQHSMAPGYLAELCRPVSSIDGHRHLYDLLAVASLTFHELDC